MRLITRLWLSSGMYSFVSGHRIFMSNLIIPMTKFNGFSFSGEKQNTSPGEPQIFLINLIQLFE